MQMQLRQVQMQLRQVQMQLRQEQMQLRQEQEQMQLRQEQEQEQEQEQGQEQLWAVPKWHRHSQGPLWPGSRNCCASIRRKSFSRLLRQ